MKTLLAIVALLVVSFSMTRTVSADTTIPSWVASKDHGDYLWSILQVTLDDIAAKKYLLAHARRADRKADLAEAISAETKDVYCPAVKEFKARISADNFNKRASIHCMYDAPNMTSSYKLTAECKAVVATVCK